MAKFGQNPPFTLEFLGPSVDLRAVFEPLDVIYHVHHVYAIGSPKKCRGRGSIYPIYPIPTLHTRISRTNGRIKT
jgi:hypothetical protein